MISRPTLIVFRSADASNQGCKNPNLTKLYNIKCLGYDSVRKQNKTTILMCSMEWIWINLALHHLLTNGSSAVNGCRQNKR